MKRQVVAVAVASLFALPALADYETGLEPNEIRPGVTYAAAATGKSRDAVRDELVAAQRAGEVIVNGELGLTAKQFAPAQYASGKTRADVLAELVEAQRTGDIVVNAELGLKANQLEPKRYGLAVLATGRAGASKL